jgi:transcriptional regulator with XRE-family HTH domain
MSAGILHLSLAGAPNRIRELREAANLTQQNLADRIGVSKVTISELEREKMRLDLSYMRRLAKALDVTPADLLLVKDNPNSLTADERALIVLLRNATDEEREAVTAMIGLLIRSVPKPEPEPAPSAA